MSTRRCASAAFSSLSPSVSRTPLFYLALVAGFLVLAAAVLLRQFLSEPRVEARSTAAVSTPIPAQSVRALAEKQENDAEQPPSGPAKTDTSSRPAENAASAAGEESAQALRVAQLERQRAAKASADRLIRGLQHMVPTQGPMTPAQASRVLRMLRQLVRQGLAAVPSLYDFLQSFQDVRFADVKGGDQVGYATLRLALLDVLGQINGPEAEATLVDQLQTTAEPDEVALLADILEERAPGYYQEEVLTAAVDSLKFVSQPSSKDEESDQDSAPPDRVDAVPLFEVLQKYPDDRTASWLKTLAGGWSKYAPLALANLPRDQGIPSLVEMVESPTALDRRSGQGQFAMRLLAQVAADNPSAQAALLEKVTANEIPERFWPMLAEVVAGAHQLRLTPPDPEDPSSPFGPQVEGNRIAKYMVTGRYFQTVYSVDYSGVLPAGDVARRLELIDRMVESTDDPTALAALARAQSLLGRGS